MISRHLLPALVIVLCRALQASSADAPPKTSARPQLVAQLGHSDWVLATAFSPDGRFILTGGEDRSARLWDARSGREILRLIGHTGTVGPVAFSPDGRWLMTAAEDVRLWDATTGRQVHRFPGHTATFTPDGRLLVGGGETVTVRETVSGKVLNTFADMGKLIFALAVSPNGRLGLIGDSKGAHVWELASGKVIRTFEGHKHSVCSVAFSPNGKWALTASSDGIARLWDATTGKELRRFQRYASHVAHGVVFSPDGHSLLIAAGRFARLWEVASGKERQNFEIAAKDQVESVAFAPDGQTVLLGHNRALASLWDVKTGKEIRRFRGAVEAILALALSPDGQLLLACDSQRIAHLWDLSTGRLWQTFPGWHGSFSPDGRSLLVQVDRDTAVIREVVTGKNQRTFRGSKATWSPDGRLVATFSDVAGELRLWDAASGKVLSRLEASQVQQLAFAPDSKSVLAVCYKPNFRLETSTIRLWDTATGRQLRAFRISSGSRAAFSPQDGLLAVKGWNPAPKGRVVDYAVQIQNAATGRVIRWIGVQPANIYALAFSPDGRTLLSGSAARNPLLWDVATGKELLSLEGHLDEVAAVAFTRGGHILVSAGVDGTVRLWDAVTGKALCQLVSFRDGSWAVVDPEGRYDASNGGNVEGLHWVVDREPVSLEQLKERYYDPGLLAKYLGHNKEPLRQVKALINPRLFPEVRLAAAGRGKLGVTLLNRSGGIGRVVIKINGKEQTADARPRGADSDAKQLKLVLDLSKDPRLLPGKRNVIEVQAFNAEGYLRSRGLEFVYDAPDGPSRLPEMWAVVCGISSYHGGKIDLRYAAKDAEDFATALRLAANRLFGPENVHLSVLSTNQPDAQNKPTRANVLAALEAARKAKPGDVVVVYLAGHGINHGGANGDFYFLSCEAQSGELTDSAVRKQVAISSAELTEAIKRIPALKQVLVLDTCASGRLVAKLTEKRLVPSSQVRALERLKDRTGMYVLAGCAADAVSYEATRYAQGLLTYSLLLGMRGAALKEGDQVDVLPLFNFACDRVPELARDVGGIQRPLLASPSGGASFPIGRLTSQDREKVPLQRVRPLVLRSNLQDEDALDDVLGLARRVDEKLRQASARGRRAPLVFVESRELPGACRVAGRYRIEAGKVAIRVSLFVGAGRAPAARFTVAGDEKKPDDLAARLADEVEKRLPGLRSK